MLRVFFKSKYILMTPDTEHTRGVTVLTNSIYSKFDSQFIVQVDCVQQSIEQFAYGQIVCMFGRVVIGWSCMVISSNYNQLKTLSKISIEDLQNLHNEDGMWLIGYDICLSKNFTNSGLEKKIISMRNRIVKKMGLRGQAILASPLGYPMFSNKMDISVYLEQVKNKKIYDINLSNLMKFGFVWHSIIQEFGSNPLLGTSAVLLIFPNPVFSDYSSN